MRPTVSLIVLATLVTLYALPTIGAILAGRRRILVIGATNFLFGWTILGWGFAWWLGFHRKRPRRKKRKAVTTAAPAIQYSSLAAFPADSAKHDVYADWLNNGQALPAKGRSPV